MNGPLGRTLCSGQRRGRRARARQGDAGLGDAGAAARSSGSEECARRDGDVRDALTPRGGPYRTVATRLRTACPGIRDTVRSGRSSAQTGAALPLGGIEVEAVTAVSPGRAPPASSSSHARCGRNRLTELPAIARPVPRSTAAAPEPRVTLHVVLGEAHAARSRGEGRAGRRLNPLPRAIT